MIVPIALFAQLSASCGPTVNVNTLAALARTESGFQSDAVSDNTTGRRYALPHDAAVALASDLVVVKRHSVDLGLMQINSANLPGLGLAVADAFDPCKNIAAAARVLVAFYQVPPVGIDAQPALLRAISGYNTGSPARGFANGYVSRVQVSAAEIVPSIRAGSIVGASGATPDAVADPAPSGPPEPPSWDVYGRARASRDLARSAAGRHAHAPSAVAQPQPATPAPVQLQPVQLQAERSADAR